MKLDRIAYRLRQFWSAVQAVPDPADLELAKTYLNAAQTNLFLSMQVSEQAHSLQVFKQLYNHAQIVPGDVSLASSAQQPDLLVAALLHDVGKSRHPLHLWERVIVVLAKAVAPERSRRWGGGQAADSAGLDIPPGVSAWRRPFVIAEQHPRWGAEMAAAAGVSQITASLISRHQQKSTAEPVSLEDRLLVELQAADRIY